MIWNDIARNSQDHVQWTIVAAFLEELKAKKKKEKLKQKTMSKKIRKKQPVIP